MENGKLYSDHFEEQFLNWSFKIIFLVVDLYFVWCFFVHTVPQKNERTAHNFSNYWAPHFTERRYGPETHDTPLLDVV